MMKRLFPSWMCFLWLNLFCLSTSGRAQENDSSLADTGKEVYDFVLLSGKLHNAYTFLGRDFGQTTPFVTTDVMYYFHSGWFINASGFIFMDSDLPLQSSISVGYQRDLSNRTDLNLSYSQFLVSGNSSVAGIQNLGVLQSTFGLDWNYLYSSLQVQALFSEHPDFFFISQHSRYFEFDQKLLNRVTVSFELQFILTAGTNRFYFPADKQDYMVGEQLEKLQLMNWGFGIPVNFGFKSLEMEVFSKYICPLNVPEFDPSNDRFVHGLEFNYFIPIKR